MIDFRKVKLDDKQWIKQRIAGKKSPTCEYTFGNIFCYSKLLDVRVADYEGFLLTKDFDNDYITYCFPAGCGDIRKALKYVVDDGIASGGKFLLFGLNDEDVKIINSLYPDEFEIHLNRDTFDYVYNRDDLANLTGRKYQPKRNHISYFMKNNNWSYESIDSHNIGECFEMSKQWLEMSESEHKDDLLDELEIIKVFCDSFDELDCTGGLLRADGRVVAYTIGEKLDDETFCVHIEKAFPFIRGAYPAINQQFIVNELSGYKYVDREDDVGIENLRKAKLSYYPVKLCEKYEAVYINGNQG